MKVLKSRKFRKILYFISCFCLIFSILSFTCLAEDLGDDSLDLKLQASNGTVFYFSEGQFLNNQTGQVYRGNLDPLSQGGEHVGFRLNLNGTYNNNTRMCTIKVSRSKNSSSYGRFRLTISANGQWDNSVSYTLPKLNTTRSNNDYFAQGWFDSNDPTKQYIDFIGELPYEFYIVTWFEYSYGAGYIRNLYYEFEWTPAFIYDSENNIEGEYNDEFEIIEEFGNNLEIGAETVRANSNIDSLLTPLKFARFAFDTIYTSLDERQRVLMWVALSFGVISIVFSIGGIIVGSIKKR